MKTAAQKIDNDIRTTLAEAAIAFKDTAIGERAKRILAKHTPKFHEIRFDIPRYTDGDELRIAHAISKTCKVEVKEPKVIGDSRIGKWIFTAIVNGSDELHIRSKIETFMRRNGSQDVDKQRLSVTKI